MALFFGLVAIAAWWFADAIVSGIGFEVPKSDLYAMMFNRDTLYFSVLMFIGGIPILIGIMAFAGLLRGGK